MPSEAVIRQSVEHYVDGWRRGDLDHLCKLLRPDSVVHDPYGDGR